MGLPFSLFPDDDGEEDSEEWSEVPVYGTIKRFFEPLVVKSFNIETLGQAALPQDEGVILASNHASYFDPVWLGAVLDRPVHWLAKADLFRHPVTDGFFKRAGAVKVDRVSGGNEAAVDTSIRIVEEGRVTGIFPEGSRSIDGSLRRGRTGVARVALHTGAPVVPAALTSYEVLPKHARVPNLDHPLVVAVGDPIRFEDMEDLATDRQACRKVTDEVMTHVGRLLEQARTHRRKLVLEGAR